MDINDIIIPENKIEGKDYKVIKELEKSISEIGLINPIIINKKYELLCGYNRITACDNLGFKSIQTIIREEDDSKIKEELIQIDENLIRKHLSPWEEKELLTKQKRIYEYLHPNSTKAFKSHNNSLPKEQRVETFESYSSHMAEKLNCSSKSITDKVAQVESIQTKSPELEKSISKLDKQIKVKGVDLKKVSKLSPDEMNSLSLEIEKNLDNKTFNLSEVLKEEKTVEKSMQQKLHEVFMYDLLEISKKLPISKIQDEINVNVEEAQLFKNELNADFKYEIDFLIKNIK